jgi:TetR/AcrR family transcriptional regulator, regulator of autoinduction and epiphytic fitness
MLNPAHRPARQSLSSGTTDALATTDAPKGLSAAPRAAPVKLSFKAQMLEVREDAIVQAASRLLAEKGFDLMTVDQVAADVGIAKASLYKHFSSKEALAAAAMVRVLGVALQYLASMPEGPSPLEQLKTVVRWMLQSQLAGEMPSLPSQNSSLRAALLGNKAYLDGLMQVSDAIGHWIEQAQTDGSLSASLPPELVLYTLYARACDPVPEFLKASDKYSHEQIIELVVTTCFDGLNAR